MKNKKSILILFLFILILSACTADPIQIKKEKNTIDQKAKATMVGDKDTSDPGHNKK